MHVVSCGFDEFFVVEWIYRLSVYRLQYNNLLLHLHVCTVTVPKYIQQHSSTAVEPTMKAPSIFQRKMLETTRGTVSSDLTESIGVLATWFLFFSAPLCQDFDLCQHSDPCRDSDYYGIQIIKVDS